MESGAWEDAGHDSNLRGKGKEGINMDSSHDLEGLECLISHDFTEEPFLRTHLFSTKLGLLIFYTQLD